MLTFDVVGVPATQGSMHARNIAGRAIIIQGGDPTRRAKLQDWRHAIASEARRALENAGDPPPIDQPVRLELLFRLPRPKSTPKRVTRPHRKPDLDKLVRLACDALTGIVWADDARVTDLHATKTYVTERPPGVTISVTALTS